MQKESIITILASVILSVGVSTALTTNNSKEATTTAPATANIGASIESYLKENPSIIRESLEIAARKEREEAEKRIAENYLKNLDELHNIENSPYVGPKDAKITIVEFFDFNCGYCKRLAPALKEVIANNKDVRFIFKPVAFLAPTSQTAAKALLVAAESGKHYELYEALLTHNGQITDSVIDEKIKAVGLDLDATKKLMNSEKVNKNFEEIISLSQNVEVQGVPTLIINGKPLRTIDASQIQNAINNLK
ncbi:MAG: DsbA family protein [Alphaproteobacteria bacterium]|nr:DsbA family protein [Alphaproteobacteria bacterium]